MANLRRYWDWRSHPSKTITQVDSRRPHGCIFLCGGLEIKQEILVGELSEPRQMVLPLAAAFGGMIVPAGFYLYFNYGHLGEAGWGIPMATDIAFALGILALLTGFLLA